VPGRETELGLDPPQRGLLEREDGTVAEVLADGVDHPGGGEVVEHLGRGGRAVGQPPGVRGDTAMPGCARINLSVLSVPHPRKGLAP
jgi:hypothetical protein